MTPREELVECEATYRALTVFLEAEKDDETAYSNFGAALEYTRRRARAAAKRLCDGERPPTKEELAERLEKRRAKVAAVFAEGARWGVAEGLGNLDARAMSYAAGKVSR